MTRAISGLCMILGLMAFGCADDSSESEANKKGVGAQCTQDSECLQEGDCATGPCIRQTCLNGFKGGYCGVKACTKNDECPTGSACVTHTDGNNYCFLQCSSKADCNVNRTAAYESNCSSSVTFVEKSTTGKACVPPSGN